ncbi:MAG TPA: ABC transporter permease [Chitinophaga sp.]|uniref:ABC transporter permease n=1 Tax=Chitinophaga sp. TaxID=1869181 RepID=UPI002DBD6BCA|nr:ABC transporter permease [Chitinophaga sp.]HEU4551368.1 ABC transporter permease [Chitinophaga sp.]
MLRNYLKIAWRNLWKTKLLTAVNILGLSVAFAASILLVMTAYHELSYDRFHANRQQLYMLYINTHYAQRMEQRANMPMPLTPAVKQECPEVRAASRMMDIAGLIRYHDKVFESNIQGVDADFLQMFSFPVIKGDARQPLSGLSNIVLSATTAKSIFGKEEAVGKQLEVYVGRQWKSFIVSAICENVPDNSSIEFDALCRFENAEGYASQKDAWNNSTHYVYVQLANHATAAAFERSTRPLVNKYFAERLRNLKRDGAVPGKDGELIGIHLKRVTDLHLNNVGAGGDNRFYPYLLLLIGAFILFIACINFMNLTIAGAFTRSREIGMRKILGAFRFQLIIQMWGEAVLVCGLALLAGLAAVYFLMPGYNALFKSRLSFTLLQQPLLSGIALAIFFLVTLTAGGYPAWIIARLNTIKVLKGGMQAGRSGKVRNTLMVTQFVISSLLICCTLIAWQQLNYLRNKPLGYNKEQVISIPIPGDVNPAQALKRMRSTLAGEANVLGITGTDINLGRGRDGSSASSRVSFDYKGHTISSNWLEVNYDYVKTLGLTLLAGRDFSPQYGTDSMGLVINEKMARQLGGVDAALGALLPVNDSLHPMQVIGIVKDFNFRSLQENIEPLSMYMQPNAAVSYIFVKVPPGNLAASMALVTKRWKEVFPGKETDPSFLDENTDRQYQKEKRFSSIFISAAVLAIVISCMGLFAISVLVMTQRTREIGVRKVLGASVTSIVALLSKDFVKLVLLSVIIASPIAWYIMEQWLQHYAYRIHIHIGIFAGAAAIAVLVAVITVSVQSIRAALMNPVKSIRTE